MATNFPGSQDSFTNPTSGDTLDSPDHAAQHTNVNDAVEAIELALLDGAPLFIDDTNERVGVGTTTPGYTLDVNGTLAVTGNSSSTISNNTSAGREILQLRAVTATNDGAAINLYGDNDSAHAGKMFLYSGGSVNVALLPSGNVGVGTTSPDVLLHVGDASTTGTLRVYNANGADGFRVLSTTVRSTSIYNTTTANAATLYISSAGTMYRSTSSAKYKTDIETLDAEHADIVFNLRPVWYRSTTGNDPEGWSYYGLIAEEVAELDPRLVHFGAAADCGCVEDNDGHIEHELSCLTEPEGVQYDRLVPHLISVVQRQQAAIDALEARIAALEA